MVRNLWDAGFSLGQNVGDLKAVLEQSRNDAMLATSLFSMHFVCGDQDVARDLETEFAKTVARGNAKRLEEGILSLLAEEAARYGNAAQLTEPNVKRSAGGLRFLLGIEWIGRLRTSRRSFKDMEDEGFLAAGDASALEDARRWLLRVRADLHFAAGKCEDVLSREEQLRIAEAWDYRDAPEQLGVERFMRDFLRRTTTVQEIADDVYFRPAARKAWGRRWLSRKSDDVDSPPPTLEEALQAAFDSAPAGKPLSSDWVAQHSPAFPSRIEFGNSVAAQPYAVSPIARAAWKPRNDAPIVSSDGPARTAAPGIRIRPMSHAIQRVPSLHGRRTHAARRSRTRRGFWNPGERTCPPKSTAACLAKGLLHLALLLHDLGKGRAEDHSEVGAGLAHGGRRAFRTAARRPRDARLPRSASTCFFRDSRCTATPAIRTSCCNSFTKSAAKPSLQQLYVLTVCDISAVSPEAYTPWKADLLADLYRRAAAWFGDAPAGVARSGGSPPPGALGVASGGGFRGAVDDAPRRFVAGLSLDAWSSLQDAWRASRGIAHRRPAEVRCRARSDFAHDPGEGRSCGRNLLPKFAELWPPIISRCLSADVNTLADGTVLDLFQVRDVHHFGAASPERLERISATVRRVVLGELAVEDALWSMRSSVFTAGKRVIASDPVRVEIDNDSSQSCTVVDVFAMDRRGLLFTLARSLHQSGLSIEYAKIATYHDEVVDVFYVKDAAGAKVVEDAKCLDLRDALVKAVRKLAQDPRSMGL